MKNIIYTFLAISLFFSCQKEEFTPVNQLADAIDLLEAKSTTPKTKIYILNNDALCNNINCDKTKFTVGQKEYQIYSRESLFMRGINSYYQVMVWEQQPIVDRIEKEISREHNDNEAEKCSGN